MELVKIRDNRDRPKEDYARIENKTIAPLLIQEAFLTADMASPEFIKEPKTLSEMLEEAKYWAEERYKFYYFRWLNE